MNERLCLQTLVHTKSLAHLAFSCWLGLTLLQIIGNALVGVVFTRNAFSVLVLFTLTPWINGMGLQNMHVLVAVLCFVILLLPIPLIVWGKKARIATAKLYKKLASRQPTHRAQ